MYRISYRFLVPGWSAKPLVSAHDRIMGTHTVANAFAERWIGTLRRELLDRTIIWNRRQLNKLVVDYIDHYNMRVRIRVGSTGGDGSITTCPASWWWLRG